MKSTSHFLCCLSLVLILAGCAAPPEQANNGAAVVTIALPGREAMPVTLHDGDTMHLEVLNNSSAKDGPILHMEVTNAPAASKSGQAAPAADEPATSSTNIQPKEAL